MFHYISDIQSSPNYRYLVYSFNCSMKETITWPQQVEYRTLSWRNVVDDCTHCNIMNNSRVTCNNKHPLFCTLQCTRLPMHYSVPAVRPKRCHTLSNPAHRQDYTVACLNYTLQTMMLLSGWPVMAPNAYNNNDDSLLTGCTQWITKLAPTMMTDTCYNM